MKSGLKKILTERLKDSKKLVILGIGSELMQDDAAGIVITENLKEKFPEGNFNYKIFTGYTTPENFTKSISDFNPDHIILVDAADLKLSPGTFSNIPVETITNFSLGTHKLSLIMMIKYLKEVIAPEFTVIAIQYKSIEFNGLITKEVKSAIKQVTELLSETLSKFK